MKDNILDELGKRYIGDPKTVGLSDSVYSKALRFDPEESSQKTLKKRYLVSMTLGQKHDTVAREVNNQVRLLCNGVGVILFVLSLVAAVVGYNLYSVAKKQIPNAAAIQNMIPGAPTTQQDVYSNILKGMSGY